MMTTVDRARAVRWMLIGAVLMGAACGGDEGGVIGAMRTFKARMCACRDAACTARVQAEYRAWQEKVGPKVATAKPTAGQLAELTKLDEAIGACAEAMGGGVATGKLEVTSLDPASGSASGGQLVTIRGHEFTSVTRGAKVYFGNQAGKVIRFASDSALIVEAPAGAPGAAVDVLVVFEPGGELNLPASFRYE